MDFSKLQEDRKNSEQEDMVFHYSRSERLKKAPEQVQNLYNGNFKVFTPGIFRALVSTKSNRLIFMSMIICFLAAVFLGIFNRPNENSLNGVPLQLSAFSFEDTVYVSVKFEKISEKKQSEDGLPAARNFQVDFEFLDAEKNVVEKRRELNIYAGEENFLRTTCRDYDIFYVDAFVSLDEKTVKLTCSVEKR